VPQTCASLPKAWSQGGVVGEHGAGTRAASCVSKCNLCRQRALPAPIGSAVMGERLEIAGLESKAGGGQGGARAKERVM